MPRSLDMPDAELAVMQVLWEHGSATIRQVADILYPGGKAAQYGTVQKLLERLEDKECVARDRGPWPHVFTPAVDRETLIGYRLRQALFSGARRSPPPCATAGRPLQAGGRHPASDRFALCRIVDSCAGPAYRTATAGACQS